MPRMRSKIKHYKLKNENYATVIEINVTEFRLRFCNFTQH